MTAVFIKRGRLNTETDIQRDNEETQKKRRWLSISQRESSGSDPSLGTLESNQSHQQLDFGLLISRTVRQLISVV